MASVATAPNAASRTARGAQTFDAAKRPRILPPARFAGALCGCALLALLCLASPRAFAQRKPPTAPAAPAVSISGNAAVDLEAAEKAYAELEYDKANRLADAVTKQRGLSHDQLVRAYRVLARTHAVLDHEKDARDAFVALLTYSPDEKEDRNLPPKVTDRQLEARGVLSGYGARPGLEVSVDSLRLRSQDSGVLRVTTRDPTHVVRKIVVGYRWGSAGSFTTTNVAAGEHVAVDVSVPPRNVSRLDYYAQALDERDDAIFEIGNPVVPKTSMLDSGASSGGAGGGGAGGSSSGGEPSKPFIGSTTFWVIAGGLVVGAGVGIFAATRPSSASSATLSPALTCGGSRCL